METPNPELFQDLLRREPVFDRPELIWDEASFEAEVAPDFREIGASGQIYTRQYVKDVVLGRLSGTRPPSLPGGFRVVDADVRVLVEGLAQITYTLHAQGRATRRSTLYRRSSGTWQVLFHQGTIVT